MTLSVTLCIATIERPLPLIATLQSLRNGLLSPTEVRVVDASECDQTAALCSRDWAPLHLTYQRSNVRSAAAQRNQAAEGCQTDLIAFCDDDVELPPEALQKIVHVFEADAACEIGGVAGTIGGLHHRVPGRWLRRYYRLQAGYDHEHYGGLFFGPAINTLPTDRPGDPELYSAQWLNAGFVVYRRWLFDLYRFPEFFGYSSGEDVNLSVQVRRTHRLYFHRGVRYTHRALGGSHKADHRRRAALQLAHRWLNATELLELRGAQRFWRFLLSQFMDSIFVVRTRGPGWASSLAGSWGAWFTLAVARKEVRVVLRQQER